jgi:hypothetical protein
MEQDQDFKLIDGIFTAEETQLLNYKIDCREDFSNHIRFNQSSILNESRTQ